MWKVYTFTKKELLDSSLKLQEEDKKYQQLVEAKKFAVTSSTCTEDDPVEESNSHGSELRRSMKEGEMTASTNAIHQGGSADETKDSPSSSNAPQREYSENHDETSEDHGVDVNECSESSDSGNYIYIPVVSYDNEKTTAIVRMGDEYQVAVPGCTLTEEQKMHAYTLFHQHAGPGTCGLWPGPICTAGNCVYTSTGHAGPIFEHEELDIREWLEIQNLHPSQKIMLMEMVKRDPTCFQNGIHTFLDRVLLKYRSIMRRPSPSIKTHRHIKPYHRNERAQRGRGE